MSANLRQLGNMPFPIEAMTSDVVRASIIEHREHVARSQEASFPATNEAGESQEQQLFHSYEAMERLASALSGVLYVA